MPTWFWISLWTTLGVAALATWLIALIRLSLKARALEREVAPLRDSAVELKSALEQERILVSRLKNRDLEGKD